MSDYTLTTEVVREVYAWRDGYPYEGAIDPQLEARFNRWLAVHDAATRTAALEEAAVIAERRRPEIGPHILDTPYRRGLHDGGTRTAESIRAAAVTQ